MVSKNCLYFNPSNLPCQIRKARLEQLKAQGGDGQSGGQRSSGGQDEQQKQQYVISQYYWL